MATLTERASQALRFDDLEGRYDPWLLAIAIALAVIGVIMVASSSMPYAMSSGLSPFYYLERHLIFLGGGVLLAVILMNTELRRIEERGQVLLLLCFLLLAAVFLPGVGRTINASRRWISLGVANFQVVEAVKLLLIVWLSTYLVRYRDEIGDSWKAQLKPLAIAGGMVLLLLMQPDFGSSMLILAVTVGMLWLGGARVRNLAFPAIAGLVLMSCIVVLEPYRVRRLVSFQNPWADAFDGGYQLVQALIAIGRGNWTGVGLGGSILKLDYLPEAHTDFIFAVIAEEFGFMGVFTLVALFGLFTWRAFRLGLRCVEMRRRFSGYCAFGIGLWISLQAFVSMGVNLGLLPTKGLTLPLVSSGGSSVLMTCAAFGVLLRISYELDRAERQVQRLRPGVEPGEPAASAPVAVLPMRGAAPSRDPRDRIEPRIGGRR